MKPAVRRFAAWLGEQLRSRNISPAEFARRAGVDKGIISRALNAERMPSMRTLRAFGDALDLDWTVVYRAAGELPEHTYADPVDEEALHIIRELETESKREVIRYLRMKVELQRERLGKPRR